MNKEINYLIEFLAKLDIANVSNLYVVILDFFDTHSIYIPSKYDTKALQVLAKKSDIELSNNVVILFKRLDKVLDTNIHQEIKTSKKQLLETIIASNFKKKKEHFDKVETAIYKTLTAYVFGLTRALDIFYIYTKNSVQKPEVFIEFANTVHTQLIDMIFNDQERELLEAKLKEVMGVYLSLYARYLYI